MDMHGIVSGAVGVVNPPVSASLIKSAGSTTAPDGRRTPSYLDPVTVMVQKQETSFKDLRQLEGLNLQGIYSVFYLEGVVRGIDRVAATNGDKIVIGADTWLVVAVPEQWPDWCRVIGCLQVTP